MGKVIDPIGMMNFIKVERLKLILSIFHMIKKKKRVNLIPLSLLWDLSNLIAYSGEHLGAAPHHHRFSLSHLSLCCIQWKSLLFQSKFFWLLVVFQIVSNRLKTSCNDIFYLFPIRLVLSFAGVEILRIMIVLDFVMSSNRSGQTMHALKI